MKKTLIALAAVAVSGAAFAQATITGGFAYGYQTAKNAAGVTTSGLGMDTAAITISASEDLGGGLKAAGSMSVGGLARGATVGGENMSLSLSGGFGSVMMGAVESGSGIRPLGSAGAPVTNMEGEVLSGAVNIDIVKYTFPKMGDFTFSVNTVDQTGTGLGVGRSSGNTTSVGAGVNYASGALAVAADYTDWNSNAAYPTPDNRVRLSAKYDLGVAAVGAGWDSRNHVGAGTNVQTIVGVSVPMGALTLGAVVVSNDTKNHATAANNVKKTGNSLGLSYALSKRTSVTASTARWKSAAGAATESSTTVLVNHSF